MTQALAVYDDPILAMEPSIAQQRLKAIAQFQAVAHRELKEGSDYGTIPGTNKPTLLKPGAEKIIKLLELYEEYEVVATEDWEKGFFAYRVTCRLYRYGTTMKVTEGLGEANSMEGRYRWRWVFQSELDRMGMSKEGLPTRRVKTGPQYRIDVNEDIYAQVNTILKIAKKRAQVDAALSVGRLSEVFTQDLEDMPIVVDMVTAATGGNQEPDSYPCPIHKGQRHQRREGRNGTFYSHKDGKGWCNRNSEEVEAALAKAQASSPPEAPVEGEEDAGYYPSAEEQLFGRPEQPQGASPTQDKPHFPNAEAFYKAVIARNEWGYQGWEAILKDLNVRRAGDIPDLDDAYQTLQKMNRRA